MTSEIIVKARKIVQPSTNHYVDINEVPELIARVIQNDLHINDLATKDAKNQT